MVTGQESSSSEGIEESPPGRKLKDSKWKESFFIFGVTGMSILFGFGRTISNAKKGDPKYFDKGISQRFEGTSLALRALGWGTLYAVAGTSLIFYTAWKLIGAKDLQEFRIKVGNILPRIPKAKTSDPSGRTEFKNLTDLLQYIIDEDERVKKTTKSSPQILEESILTSTGSISK